jgi:hypothetical protein
MFLAEPSGHSVLLSVSVLNPNNYQKSATKVANISNAFGKID